MPAITTTENDVKERLSVGLVSLIAARAGCQIVTYDVDRMSCDIQIKPISGANVSIDAQLKATVNLLDAGDRYRFDLSKKNYDDLRSTEVGNAQILIVVDLHGMDVRWVRQTSRRLVFEKCAYWVSLYGQPEKTNRSTVRIDIPKTQVLTPQEVQSLMERRLEKIRDQDGGL